jgi:hypothetical protein
MIARSGVIWRARNRRDLKPVAAPFPHIFFRFRRAALERAGPSSRPWRRVLRASTATPASGGVGVGGYTLTMYIGLGTVVFILVIVLIIYLVRRA